MKQYKTLARTFKLVQEAGPEVRKAKITSSEVIDAYVRPLIGDQMNVREVMWMIMMNNANNTIGHYKMSEGGINATLADVRLCLRAAIGCLATSVIFAHNHPSGALKPSSADISLTKKLVKAFNTIDIRVLDHLIVSEDGYYSFNDDDKI